ncbi:MULTISPECIES: hypothetical protein [unclassified Clostridium]|uniref:hypothetical protein n=1 Tax=unclassified Clostridium TaxID=2614128 RepID=UPI0002978F0C|nr:MULTISPECIES: hypothetical protein [unclassified Clostridium]EKQ57195.1 MAG: hypothetical protein A370_01169 [Clostridium sp. Maddingley MBC34-26]
MIEKLVCPLKFASNENQCVPNCAWNAGSESNLQCAILKISFNLTSLDKHISDLLTPKNDIN